MANKLRNRAAALFLETGMMPLHRTRVPGVPIGFLTP